MKTNCSLCGCSYGNIYTFKTGHVCENCVRFMKMRSGAGTHVQTESHN